MQLEVSVEQQNALRVVSTVTYVLLKSNNDAKLSKTQTTSNKWLHLNCEHNK